MLSIKQSTLSTFKVKLALTYVFMCLGGLGYARSEPPLDPSSLESEDNDFDVKNSEESFTYEVGLSKATPKFIREAFDKYSTLARLKSRPLYTVTGLMKRAKDDEKILRKILKSFGYFDAIVSYEIKEYRRPVRVKFRIDFGDRYKVKDFTFSQEIPQSIEGVSLWDLLEYEEGMPLDVETLSQAKDILLSLLQNRGYPFAEVEDPTGTLDKASKTVSVKFVIQKGPLVYMGPAHIVGLQRLNPGFIQNRLRFREGDLYNQKKVDQTRRKLLESGLFSSLSMEMNKESHIQGDDTAHLPIKIVAQELAPKHVGVGLRYASFEGPGGKAFWHHNNVRGGGEHFGISFGHSKKETEFKTEYDIPDFVQGEQKLHLEGIGLRERKKAYHGRTYVVESSLENPLKEWLTMSVGVRGERARLVREDEVFTPSLLGVPLEARADWSNSLLDPTRGMRLKGWITPYFGKLKSTNTSQTLHGVNVAQGMTMAKGELKTYIPFWTDRIHEDTLTLANFVRLGTVMIKKLTTLPPNKRFYLGGGDSVRAYGPQMLGPVDAFNVPLGGRSFLEAGTEARFRFSKTMGGVCFLEGGSVMETKLPTWKSKKVLWGWGVGARYFSPVGPIRFDLAFPSKRRTGLMGKKIDSPFQFYVSVGQAF